MVRIIIFSDTHNNASRMEKVLNTIIGVDAVIHCGDGMGDVEAIKDEFAKISFFGVRGNCDYKPGKAEQLLELGGKKIFVTHGHGYNVKSEHDFEYTTIRERGRELGADAVLFGHTHIPYNRNWGDIVVMNPGSIKYEGTYGVIEIENGRLKSAVCNLF